MGLGRLCCSHCCNVHVLQISPSSETLMPAASQRTWDDAAVTVSLFFTPLFYLPFVTFFCRLQSLNILIELKSASQITAQDGERLIAFQLPNRKKDSHSCIFQRPFFCCWYTTGPRPHCCNCTRVKSSWSLNVICSPVEVNEGLFTLQH